MTRIKRHASPRNHEEMKRYPVNKCSCRDQEKHHNEIIDYVSRIIGRSTGYKDLPASYLQKCVNSEVFSNRYERGKKVYKKRRWVLVLSRATLALLILRAGFYACLRT
ncbi:PREDICTED: uncharacterized protein LOC105450924 isoform X1 [Wasmannia auropunctata]|uniref:uncharacterized protein LOC105450924 isoform X1 n=1 Tax=Wasmannia auropunctata TaxID=64793 RepID=UPI0005EE4F74|nr:PREDICTED: uncharacterized protein LOC105450924 isoform X1 [Wasmannia auropunctata]XP_011689351.1 PREDICTED: uncharacterized protein LOC105450924 isoform X1 [Wasmannia auropunctata]XP_011689352.1 PREDICTED: uncharacterized protein LOC105450924 isoform X1 [Wasmannia auropunctata]XP_011689353.1 PREDICTED: uncharacterized protein LOC105450924 isoform X1 [Wasmannia auropunctata]